MYNNFDIVGSNFRKTQMAKAQQSKVLTKSKVNNRSAWSDASSMAPKNVKLNVLENVQPLALPDLHKPLSEKFVNTVSLSTVAGMSTILIGMGIFGPIPAVIGIAGGVASLCFYPGIKLLLKAIKVKNPEAVEFFENNLENITAIEFKNVIDNARSKIKTIHELNDDIPGEPTSSLLKEICNELEKLINKMVKDPKSIDTIRKATTLYLDRTIKLSNEIVNLLKKAQLREIKDTMENFDKTLIELLDSIRKFRNDLIEDEKLRVNATIKAHQQAIKLDR